MSRYPQPRGGRGSLRWIPASTRSVAGPVGQDSPFSLARNLIAATIWAQVAGAGDFSGSANKPAR